MVNAGSLRPYVGMLVLECTRPVALSVIQLLEYSSLMGDQRSRVMLTVVLNGLEASSGIPVARAEAG